MNERLLGAAVVALLSFVGIASAAQLKEGAAAQAPPDNGVFYVKCNFSHRAPDDAIVYPGQPGRSHLHDFFGNKTTNASSTGESLRAAAATTCNRDADGAAYWTPTLYQDETRVPVKVDKVVIAYNSGLREGGPVQPFPEDFKMIAGDASATEEQPGRPVDWDCEDHRVLDEGRSPDNSPRAQALRAAIREFDAAAGANRRAMIPLRRAIRRHRKAIRRQRKAIRAQKARGRAAAPRRMRLLKRHRRALARKRAAYRRHRRAFLEARSDRQNREAALQSYLFGGGTSIPTCAPGANLKLEVTFPACWDGHSIDSADHKSHVAYNRRENGKWVCPDSHPVLLPVLHLKVVYESRGGTDVRLSPGDVDAGHADFMNGWDQPTLEMLVQECLNNRRPCKREEPGERQPAPQPQPQPNPQPQPQPQPNPQPQPQPNPDPNPDPDPLPIPLP